ncbi:MAG: serine hydrolase domain-containing protein [Acidimicrobiales bacterium]
MTDRAALGDLLDEAFGSPARTPSVDLAESLACVVMVGDEVVAERYGPGLGPDSTLLSWSMAKSVTHALVGVLVGEGRLDIGAPAPVPEWAGLGDARHAITVDHLLAMRPGLAFVEDYVDDTVSDCIDMLFGSGAADMGAYAAAKPLVAEPDTVFNYSSGTTNVVCRIVADLVGRGPAMESWMRAVLFDPLAMASAAPKFDEAGVFVGSSYLYATARDFARFGALYRDDGCVGGRRILPEGWVAHGTVLRSRDDEGHGYGAHWWVWDEPAGAFCAQGYEAQRTLVVPDRDLVVVRLGKTPVERGPLVDDWLRRVADAVA